METIIKAIKDKLDSMVGKSFQYASHIHIIKRYEIQNTRDRVFFQTDRADYDRTFDSFFDFISLFKPVEIESLPISNQLVRQVDGSVISSLKDTLLDNIAKIKSDRTYIPQAEAIKGNVDSIIDLAKTEIAYMMAFNKINGK